MKPDLSKLALPLGLLGLNAAISLGFLLSGKLPNPTPAGFWIDGSVLSEAPPWVVAFRLPMVMAVLLLCIGAALKWDPRFAAHERRSGGAWGPITQIFLAVGCIGNYNTLSAASAGAFAMTPMHMLPTGLFLLGMGNFIAKSASNGFWGLHNRWTRSHEIVARRTNRLLGILYMAEGLGLILASPVLVSLAQRPNPNGVIFALSILPVVVLGFLPLAVAALASYRFAKQAPVTANGG
ncbi:hypothetical protein D3C86_388770 [compost metagenome]